MAHLLVRARGASYRYPSGRRGVEAVDLDVSPGEIVALLGPNGAGKTTLLRLLVGDLGPSGGRIDLGSLRSTSQDGEGAGAEPTSETVTVGFAGDQPVHFDALTGWENALFFVRAQGLDGARARARLDPLLEALGLAEDGSTPVSRYSFGMKRKLLLAQALAPDFSVLALDEPTIGLDPASRNALARTLAQRATAGSAVLLATNDLDFVPGVAHRVVFLHEGRIVADAQTSELLARVRGSTRITVTARSGGARSVQWPDGVVAVGGAPEAELWLESTRGTRILPAVCESLLAAGIEVRGIEVTEPGLAHVFKLLTGRALDR